MTRVPRIVPDELSGAAAELYALYASGVRAQPGSDFSLLRPDGQLIGPPATWMHNPELGLGLERLGREIRFNLSLPARSREIVILLVAEAEDNDFERYAHHRAGARAGLTTEEITGLATGDFAPANSAEAMLVELAGTLLAGHEISDELWSRAVGELGDTAVFEVVTLIGYYRMMALQLRSFRQFSPS